MNLVEFFNNEPIENIVATLIFKPERVVFIGYDDVMTDEKQKSIRKYFKYKGIDIKTEFLTLERHNLKSIVNTLIDIYKRYPESVFDFTGGEELITAGMGIVMERFNLSASEIDVSNGVYYKDLNSTLTEKINVENSIYENILLHGGIIDKSKQKSLNYNLNSQSKSDVYELWEICKANNSLWNNTVGMFKNLEDNRIPQSEANSIIKKLVKKGFINVIKSNEYYIRFAYKNSITETCLNDPGVILELYTYYAMKDIGKYKDVNIGVVIDWDGQIHGLNEKSKDTANEIDVVAMDGLKPVYISCKNGKLTKETLYELETVSSRFGGKYSTKILVAPILENKTISNEYIKHRAEDMGIKIISDVSKITIDEFKERLLP